MKTQVIALTIVLIFVMQVASAVVVNSVQVDPLFPGDEGIIKIQVENILEDDVQDVTINLDFTNLPFIPLTSSSDGFDELESDDEGMFSFRIRASNDITPGDYKIPYMIKFDHDGVEKERIGTIGVKVIGTVELSFSIDTENPIIGQEGKITLKMVNKGFADAKFASVKVLANGYTLISESEIYIGTIDSDDFETATFDVIFNNPKPTLSAIVEFKDFNNNEIIKNIDVPITIYSKEKAIELGLIEKNNTPTYVGVVIALIILWIIWRTIAKRRRLKRSMIRK